MNYFIKKVYTKWYHHVLLVSVLYFVNYTFVIIKQHKRFNTFGLCGLQFEVLR